MNTTRDVIIRCDRDAERLETLGQESAANTLYMAARELEKLLLKLIKQEKPE